MHILRSLQGTCQSLLPKHVVGIRSKFRRGFCTPIVSDPDFRIVFLGNDNFSIPSLNVILECVHSSDCVWVVVSNRRNAVGKIAGSRNLNVILWEDFKTMCSTESYNLGVVASFGHLIPKRVIERCERGILNVHASLLPQLRGASPINWAIMNGQTETGISIMNIAPHKFDIGPVLLKRKCPIHPHVRAPELTHLLSVIGAKALGQVLGDLKNSLLKEEKQRDEEATLAPKLHPGLAHIRWDQYSSVQVYNLFRGLYGSYKLYTSYGDKKVDLDDIGLVIMCKPEEMIENVSSGNQKGSISESTDFSNFYPSPVLLNISSSDKIWKDNFEPGQILVYKNSLLVMCADKKWIFSNRIKIGTKWMSAADFKNGFLSKKSGPALFLSDDISSMSRTGVSVESSEVVNR